MSTDCAFKGVASGWIEADEDLKCILGPAVAVWHSEIRSFIEGQKWIVAVKSVPANFRGVLIEIATIPLLLLSCRVESHRRTWREVQLCPRALQLPSSMLAH